jgi:holo-[acyl-carrier protein] synthase
MIRSKLRTIGKAFAVAEQGEDRPLMLQGLGIDIVEVARIKKALDRWGDRFLRRVFTQGERDYCKRKAHPEQSLAARFAAKEAVLKALGTGLSLGTRWTDVEVVNTASGKPEVRLGERIIRRVGDKKVLLTISHTRELAIAQAVLVEGGQGTQKDQSPA